MTRRLFSSILASGLALAITGCMTTKQAKSSVPDPEYKAVSVTGDGPDVESQINTMSQQGWHLVSMSAGGGDATHYPMAILVFKHK